MLGEAFWGNRLELRVPCHRGWGRDMLCAQDAETQLVWDPSGPHTFHIQSKIMRETKYTRKNQHTLFKNIVI